MSGGADAILVAGIGNIFLGDDGFGVEVVHRLDARLLGPDVVVVDFGIRSYDLAFALARPWQAVVLVDAYAGGHPPGTLSLLAIGPESVPAPGTAGPAADAHTLHPLAVLALAGTLTPALPPVWLVGCEPASWGPEEGQMGLTDTVAAAVPAAVELVVDTVRRVRARAGREGKEAAP
ncbi:Hydrogenase maturation protease [Candidatus Hydrogenisulfobacillus filiaventi]|uniref:Hydrogenase maturation protease n=1 Tax=Candidatus Hydrogenisulfobacillus filiaventi TaxID=2707344 RepID=A0A6F8ZIE8_9FIRM|nr:hydrogenase maturation protease [Bacillota bacterium]CAB1129767.1 Hydrogenase maturation protease [Candidatus Hydrogenisulfobacillus filiaventi]